MSHTPVIDPIKSSAFNQHAIVSTHAIEMHDIDESLDTEPQSLLPAGSARSSSMQVRAAGTDCVHVENNLQERSSHILPIPKLDFSESFPFCSWLDSLVRHFGIGSASCINGFDRSNNCVRYGIRLLCFLLYSFSVSLPYLICFAIDVLLMLLYQIPKKLFSKNTIQEIRNNPKIGLTAICSIVILLSLTLPISTPNGHNGDSVMQGSCNARTRCDKSAHCDTLSPSTYTCSCPSWLIGSGFDDDPCICERSVLSVPDFGRYICVTKTSHFTMAGLIGFIVGMTIFFMVGICAAVLGVGHVFWGWAILVGLAASGQLNPYPNPICGQSSFGAQVCEVGTNCIDGVCLKCPQGQRWAMDAGVGTCILGANGRCTPQSCDTLQNTTCKEHQVKVNWYHECSSNSMITSAPGIIVIMILMMIELL